MNNKITIAYEKFRIARKQFEENLDQRSAKHSEKAQSEFFKLINSGKR